ncbi:hypothetical protein [Altererythrobacter fulvus]|uniref:hypothetical protein n=1 Tax=Caenibius fulvus TaxID=2126012 RepID=UPI0030179959
MTGKPMTSRRSFLKSGAIVAAPIAVVAGPATAAAMADDGSRARLARLEDTRAIEALNRSFLRRFNGAGAEATASLFADGKAPHLAHGATRLSLDDAEEPAYFELAEDGARASAHYACTVETEHALEGDNTLVQMALLQGNSAHRGSEQRLLKADYVRREGGWAIASIRLG